MFEDFTPNNESEQGAFNAAVEYLRTITAIEREIDTAFLETNYTKVNILLDILWGELHEWMKENIKKDETQSEVQKHDELRRIQKKLT